MGVRQQILRRFDYDSFFNVVVLHVIYTRLEKVNFLLC